MIRYIDRKTAKERVEKVYGAGLIELFYGGGRLSLLLRRTLLPLLARKLWSSRFYGWLQKRPGSRKKILPFIKNFSVDSSEFLEPVSSYTSFNDFFTRRLKRETRPLASGEGVAIVPVDGRLLVYENIERSTGFLVKGKKFTLATLLRDPALASRYEEGGMVLARLAPVDYHRFHFPADCTPAEAREITGTLFSVNPLALKGNIAILSENKRKVTQLSTKAFGEVLSIEVGATHVGTIHETFVPGKLYAKGDEKGYFSFGGSFLILLFEKGRIQFDEDLIKASQQGIETLCQMGTSLGKAY